jgi:hypothetical protein
MVGKHLDQQDSESESISGAICWRLRAPLDRSHTGAQSHSLLKRQQPKKCTASVSEMLAF